jgi:cell division protease FtsH
MANEAAILALRQNKTLINGTNLVDAYEKITIGLPRLSKDVNKEEENLVAYHEAGHTITALLFKEFFDVRKVTITANSNGAGGFTLFTPKESYNSYATKKYLLANMIITMGGRAAEMIYFEKMRKQNKDKESILYNESKLFNSFNNLDITTGASVDLKQLDNLARKYIELFGIEYNNSLTKTIQNPNSPYLSLSETSKTEIDNYINALIMYSLKQALHILLENNNTFEKLASDLVIKKSVNLDYLNQLSVNYY